MTTIQSLLRNFYLILSMALLSLTASATHIVGGDMSYICLGNNNYRVTLNVYRDCFPNDMGTVTDFDDPAFIGVFDINGSAISIQQIGLGNTNSIAAAPSNPCYQAPANICVDQGVYSFDINLPAAAGGYDVVYQRCCRNSPAANPILNILNPANIGATYTVHIDPSLAVCDNSPQFKNFPPIVICADQALVFDHSATDADGDVLKYSFYNSLNGASQNNPAPQPSPPPYQPLTYRSPYSLTNLVGGNPVMTIDPNTGIINANPSGTGRYVVGVMVQEYRNGVLIGAIKRDFQFNVTSCNRSVIAKIPVVDTVGAAAANIAGIYKVACDSLNVRFENNSVNATTYFWNFGDPATTADTAVSINPSYTYPAAGDYIVTLIANPGFFCADTTKVLVKAYPGFNTNFTYTAGCENVKATFKDSTYTQYGTVNSWHWNFGDGGLDSVKNILHDYTDGGTYPVQLISTSDKGCKDTLIKQVTILPIAKGIINTGPPCLNLPIAISTDAVIKSGTFTYNWDFGNGSTATVNPTTATYPTLGSDSITLILTSDKGCKDTLGKRFTIVTPPVIQTIKDTALCANQPVALTTSGGVHYHWTPSVGLSDDTSAFPIATPADTTTYIVTGSDPVGCQGYDTVTINIWPLPNTDAGKDTYVCTDSFLQLHGTGGITFEWTPNHLINNTHTANPVILADSLVNSVTYYLTSYTALGCSNKDSIHIQVQHHIVPSLFGKNVICRNDTAQLLARGGTYYQWTPTDGLNSSTDSLVIASPADNTTYTVIVSNDCFMDSLKLNLKVNQLPPLVATGADTMLRDETDTVSATGASVYLWKPAGVYDSTGALLAVSPFNTTTYVVIGTDTNGCKNKDSVTIFVNVQDLVVLPSAFTPNGDGTNDKFRIIRHLNVQELLEFSVFSRWGKKVFSTTDINDGWDGEYEGSKMNMDVFTWLVRAVNRDGKTLSQKGNVTLVR